MSVCCVCDDSVFGGPLAFTIADGKQMKIIFFYNGFN